MIISALLYMALR